MKLYFEKTIFLILTLTIIGCSSDENDSKAFESSILIDDITFVPKEVTAFDASTSLEKRIDFILIKNINTSTDLDEMVFTINYPISATNASGTYLMNGYQGNGTYTKGDVSFNFYNGSILVDDLGNNKFNITFQNVKGNIGNGNPQIITITGSINGRFQTSN